MKKIPPPVPIPKPPAHPPGLAADVVASGQPVHPEDRIKLFSDRQWERFVQEWVDSLEDQYDLVERCGGAGDMGRDVIALVKGGNGAWDNYQCKHHKESLKPSDIWIELGKLAYYTLKGEYTYPRRYFFIAPQGAGTKLSNLLKKPEELRAGLLANWDKECRERITETEVVECDAAMRAHIASLNFSIFEATPVLRIIDAHREDALARRHLWRRPARTSRSSRAAGDPSGERDGLRWRASARLCRPPEEGRERRRQGPRRRTTTWPGTSPTLASSSTARSLCAPSRETRCRPESSRSCKTRSTRASKTTCATITPTATDAWSLS